MLYFQYPALIVELEGVKTISWIWLVINTLQMDKKKKDILETGKTRSPKDDLYDYEVPEWMKNEYRKVWLDRLPYKYWIK